ncbi:uncharacterized protein LOC132303730 isoform X2 [Cornus florida]|uniref:uncharacterized protein LOC132303730 isoform X2 n=1 Tax=Cornus florida TaxID=4283 RepID=UPI00289C6606|nr:uncharacterized protein LOC132303730 isoform X2 [Cornus florida]
MERNNNSNHNRERVGGVLGGGGDHGFTTTATTLRTSSSTYHQSEVTRSTVTASSEFVLQWGNRKRLRCMKIQVKDNNNNNNDSASAAAPVHRTTTVRVDRRVVRSDANNNKGSGLNQPVITNNNTNGFLNLRQRPSSPSRRILRNSEGSIGMKGHHGNGVRGLASPERGGAQDKRGTAHNSNMGNNNNHNHISNENNNHINNNNNNGGSASSETAHDSKRGGSSSGSDAIPMVWPPKFVIALTNKEKEEDFMAIKGSKLPQRPKKRAKFIQRTLNVLLQTVGVLNCLKTKILLSE